ncbi:MAG: hypothetical protein IPO48_06315 [Saprospiraceae bacterium]|nr:hypothetical protein [Saprospiraceae bacterium]
MINVYNSFFLSGIEKLDINPNAFIINMAISGNMTEIVKIEINTIPSALGPEKPKMYGLADIK